VCFDVIWLIVFVFQSASMLMSADMFGRAVDRLLNMPFVVQSVRMMIFAKLYLLRPQFR